MSAVLSVERPLDEDGVERVLAAKRAEVRHARYERKVGRPARRYRRREHLSRLRTVDLSEYWRLLKQEQRAERGRGRGVDA